MIKTFEDLYEKLKADGHFSVVIRMHFENKKELDEKIRIADEKMDHRTALENINKREEEVRYIMGYLSGLEDIGYITHEEGNSLFDLLVK